MAGNTRKYAGWPGLRAARPTFPGLSLGICLTFFLGLMCTGAAKASEHPGGSHGPGAQIAIADFDGDRYPDLASIQTGSSDGSRTSYWIGVRLTSAGQKTIQVMGPIGGLEIAARDVNGDHAIDLVLTAAWFRQPVAILLNDGHGNFSTVEPTDFPGAFDQSRATWGAPAFPIPPAAVNPTQWRADVSEPARGTLRPRPQSQLVALPDSGVPHSHFLISDSCRAPPFGLSSL
jgi:hypothetical protein